ATATDPGIATNGDQIEATADAEWAGAAAPDAMLKLVVAASSDTTDGVLLAALYSVDHNVAPILNVSYSACEAGLSSSGNAFVNNMWQQAAAEGITVLVSAGDSGGAACDDPTASVATSGAAVNGMASTPYDTAVGGTELNEGTQAGYWGTARGDYSSATGYIPEQPWDESGGDTGGGGLNAGGGGASTIYTNPYWQIADGIPSNNSARLVPDVSLAAAGGHDGYVICINGACAVNSGGSFKFNVVGGTSLATPSFAGMMALVDQKTANVKGLGLINPVLYRLYPASSTALAACASGGPPAASCIFNDITTGSNDVLCTPVNVGHCSASGKLGYNAAAGYDLATGLGSVNAANLVNGWSSITFPVSQTTLSVPASETVGQSTALSITVAPAASGGTAASPTGTVDLMAQGSDGSEALVQSYTLGAGGTTGNVSTVALPGGTYNVVADYEGDANYGPSTSSAASITVAKATPTVTLQLAFSAPQPFYFGDSLQTQVTVSGPAGAATATGTVTSNYSSGSSAVTAFGATTLDPTGLAVVTDPFTAAPGTYQFTAQYAGDNSYNAAGTTTAPMLTVLPSPTGITISQGGAGHIEVALSTQSQNAFPAAAPQIFDGTTAMGTVSLGAPTANANTGFLAATGTFALPANLRAPGTITVQYAGETGFTKSTSNPVTIPGYTLAGGSAATVSAGQTATITITATPFGGFTGTVSLSCSGLPAGATCSSKPATLDGTQAASMALSIQTTGTQAGAVAAWEWPGNRTEDYGLLLLCALGLIAISVAWRRRQFAAWAGMAALSALLLLTAACGGGSGPPPVKRDVTPAGIYTITISGSTTGQPATTITVHLTVI
ncbi:MAG: Ig-like domain repeat protein, partial [Terriglobales bacterium]